MEERKRKGKENGQNRKGRKKDGRPILFVENLGTGLIAFLSF